MDYVFPDWTAADAYDDRENAREEEERPSVHKKGKGKKGPVKKGPSSTEGSTTRMTYAVDKSNPEEEENSDDDEVVHHRFDRPEDLDLIYPTNERQRKLSREDYLNMRYVRSRRQLGLAMLTDWCKTLEISLQQSFLKDFSVSRMYPDQIIRVQNPSRNIALSQITFLGRGSKKP